MFFNTCWYCQTFAVPIKSYKIETKTFCFKLCIAFDCFASWTNSCSQVAPLTIQWLCSTSVLKLLNVIRHTSVRQLKCWMVTDLILKEATLMNQIKALVVLMKMGSKFDAENTIHWMICSFEPVFDGAHNKQNAV